MIKFGKDGILNSTSFSVEDATVVIPKNTQGTLNILVDDFPNEIIIIVEENANITVVEESMSSVNLTMKIGNNSSVSYLLIETGKETGVNRHFFVSENAVLDGILGLFDRTSKTDISIDMLGQGGNASINSIVNAQKEGKKDLRLCINHLAAYTNSEVNNYCVAYENAKINCNIIGNIEKGMIQSVAKQKTRGMMMAQNAHIEIDPTLLISEFDVKANHGATIGKISDEDLFYIMSRGISKEGAMRLIVDGFLVPIIARIDDNYKEKFSALAKGM